MHTLSHEAETVPERQGGRRTLWVPFRSLNLSKCCILECCCRRGNDPKETRKATQKADTFPPPPKVNIEQGFILKLTLPPPISLFRGGGGAGRKALRKFTEGSYVSEWVKLFSSPTSDALVFVYPLRGGTWEDPGAPS